MTLKNFAQILIWKHQSFGRYFKFVFRVIKGNIRKLYSIFSAPFIRPELIGNKIYPTLNFPPISADPYIMQSVYALCNCISWGQTANAFRLLRPILNNKMLFFGNISCGNQKMDGKLFIKNIYLYTLLAELGTRQYCRDNMTMFGGEKKMFIIGLCLHAFRHRGLNIFPIFFLSLKPYYLSHSRCCEAKKLKNCRGPSCACSD